MDKLLAIVFMIPASAGTLPGNARRVDSCPEAHNITAWKEASIRLNCSDDIRKKALYHCLPSSYLNETIEFCASNAAIDEGHCPIYYYAGGATAATSQNCSNFTEGCPRPTFPPYHSDTFYQYPACLDINKSFRCYYAMPNCPRKETRNEQLTENHEKTSIVPSAEIQSTMAASGRDYFEWKIIIIILTAVVPVLFVILICLMILAVYFYRKKNRKKEAADIEKREESKLLPNNENTTESSECRNKQEDNDTSKREFVKQKRKDSILNTGCSKEIEAYFDDKRQNSVECSLCDNQVSFFCIVCKKDLCVPCVVKHLRLIPKGCHNIVEFKNKDSVCFCEYHPQKECEAYCKSCDASICLICATLKHNLHETFELSEKINELLQLIKQGNDLLQSWKNESWKVLDQTTKLVPFISLSYKQKTNEVMAIKVKIDHKMIKESLEELENTQNEFEEVVVLPSMRMIEERIKKINKIDEKLTKLQKSKNVKELQDLLSVIEETLREFKL